MTFYKPLIHSVCELAVRTGEGIMRYYESGEYEAIEKSDYSPVTDADLAANAFIVEALARWAPEIPIVSEEGDKPQMDDTGRFWLVDPLDGTKSFIRKSGEFTVNIALIDAGRPVFGVMYIPVTGVLYYGSDAFGAYRQKPKEAPRRISARVMPEEGMDIIVSMAHKTPQVDAWLEGKTVLSRKQASSSLKFGVVAEGNADAYPRFGRTMEWDTAAGQAIVEAAGGRVLTLDGEPLRYGKAGYENPGFVAYGKEAVASEDLNTYSGS